MLREFRKDPYFLLKYNAKNAAFVVALGIALWITRPAAFDFPKVWFGAMAVFMAPSFFVIVGGGSLVFFGFLAEGGLAGRLWPLALVPAALYGAFLSALFM